MRERKLAEAISILQDYLKCDIGEAIKDSELLVRHNQEINEALRTVLDVAIRANKRRSVYNNTARVEEP